ncbi:hypothetical protein EPIR_2130 [Erwinia piriflorinigrans CFBP 5888]|uniref:Uncharacterized protein n=1 Tax=Erwinia piriflorinigrans CFBP 5888 TaxID=1161919 RepID=V5Z9A0_9GAMM|nr:hypothetical protein EPIR_2130 [Erwinia piriflorinigrans CFBP 5888]
MHSPLLTSTLKAGRTKKENIHEAFEQSVIY